MLNSSEKTNSHVSPFWVTMDCACSGVSESISPKLPTTSGTCPDALIPPRLWGRKVR